MIGQNLNPEPTDPRGASPDLHDGQRRDFVRHGQARVDSGSVGPTARFHPPFRDPANRDLELPIAYRAARWAAIVLISATTTLIAWLLVHAGVVGWFADLFWNYLSWLPFVG